MDQTLLPAPLTWGDHIQKRAQIATWADIADYSSPVINLALNTVVLVARVHGAPMVFGRVAMVALASLGINYELGMGRWINWKNVCDWTEAIKARDPAYIGLTTINMVNTMADSAMSGGNFVACTAALLGYSTLAAAVWQTMIIPSLVGLALSYPIQLVQYCDANVANKRIADLESGITEKDFQDKMKEPGKFRSQTLRMLDPLSRVKYEEMVTEGIAGPNEETLKWTRDYLNSNVNQQGINLGVTLFGLGCLISMRMKPDSLQNTISNLVYSVFSVGQTTYRKWWQLGARAKIASERVTISNEPSLLRRLTQPLFSCVETALT